jgi:serine/threonine protein phosphatase PrpC
MHVNDKVMVAPKLPSTPTQRKRRRKPLSPGQLRVDKRVLLIPLGLAGLAIAWNVFRLCRSLVRPKGAQQAALIRREHSTTTSSWSYDWCDEEKHCAYALPFDLEDFLPPLLLDEPLITGLIPDPADLFNAAFVVDDYEDNNSSNNTTANAMTDDLDNHLDRFGNLLMNPSMFLSYPPTPRVLVEARRNLTLTTGHRYNIKNRNITHRSISSTTKGDHFALISRRGLGGTHSDNQDRAILVDPFPLALSSIHKNHKEKDNPLHNNFFMSIFDGHGLSGHVKADHAAATLPKVLQEQLEKYRTKHFTDAQIRAALQASFLEVHKRGPLIHDSGCTASAILSMGQGNKYLYFANTGDSRSMLVEVDMEQRQVNIIHATKQHKPNDPEERQRITTTGCVVMDPIPFHDPTARVAENPEGKASSEGLALAMSRSLGDYDFEHCGVIPDPTISVFDRSRQSKHAHKVLLAVSVTDGLFDEVTLEDIAHGLATPFLNRNTYLGTFASALELAAEDLIRTASDRWLANTTMFPYRDDITIAVRQVQ